MLMSQAHIGGLAEGSVGSVLGSHVDNPANGSKSKNKILYAISKVHCCLWFTLTQQFYQPSVLVRCHPLLSSALPHDQVRGDVRPCVNLVVIAA